MQFDQETCSLIFKNRSSFSVIGTQSYSRIIEIMEDFLSHFPGSAHADWVLCVIQRWIHVRKPRQRLTTTLKLLSKEFEENFSEIWEQCAKSRNDSGRFRLHVICGKTSCVSKSTQISIKRWSTIIHDAFRNLGKNSIPMQNTGQKLKLRWFLEHFLVWIVFSTQFSTNTKDSTSPLCFTWSTTSSTKAQKPPKKLSSKLKKPKKTKKPPKTQKNQKKPKNPKKRIFLPYLYPIS